eukprot:CAMPEP_0185205252 /NCGR_PEP_ID=MMETSP1140-20130426/56332_1 /TAXON_ID=298111 /ORGANISM="Pavlova sp., Strain CCMP459" /LENGTH=54 /DNA_ID=CAMNT_0027772841 /DNA_START=1 /DNA_END=162 /DNA_ORIENTATION=-
MERIARSRATGALTKSSESRRPSTSVTAGARGIPPRPPLTQPAPPGDTVGEQQQ